VKMSEIGFSMAAYIFSAQWLLYSYVEFIMKNPAICDNWRNGNICQLVNNAPKFCGPKGLVFYQNSALSGCTCSVGGPIVQDPSIDCENEYPVLLPGEARVDGDGDDVDHDDVDHDVDVDVPVYCSSERSVVVNTQTCEAWMCFKGQCQYTVDGQHWTGLKITTLSPYCLVAMTSTNKMTTLWGINDQGVPVTSTNQGESWVESSANYLVLPGYSPAVTDYSNPTPSIRGNSHHAPPSSFPGCGDDLWWLTPDELCLQSSSLSSFHNSMISCSNWICDCVDADKWLASFGINATTI